MTMIIEFIYIHLLPTLVLEHPLASLVYRGGFPSTRRARARLLLSGKTAYEETLRLIANAVHTIHVMPPPVFWAALIKI